MGVVRRSGKLGWLFQADPAKAKKSQREETCVRIQLQGTEASIVWGWQVAATISSWRVAKNDKGQWTLTATATKVEPFYLRQTQPTLLFVQGPAQPCWPIEELGHEGNRIRARLGPVEF